MICPKCHCENPEAARFCVRCHMTLYFTCPACKHTQDHGGKCDQCGVDFAKYAVMMELQMESQEKRQREQAESRNALVKQALLLPVTGGWSLLKYMRTALRGE